MIADDRGVLALCHNHLRLLRTLRQKGPRVACNHLKFRLKQIAVTGREQVLKMYVPQVSNAKVEEAPFTYVTEIV